MSINFCSLSCTYDETSASLIFSGTVATDSSIASIQFGFARSALRPAVLKPTNNGYKFSTKLPLKAPHVPVHSISVIYLLNSHDGLVTAGELSVADSNHESFFKKLNQSVPESVSVVSNSGGTKFTKDTIAFNDVSLPEVSVVIRFSGNLHRLMRCLTSIKEVCSKGTQVLISYPQDSTDLLLLKRHIQGTKFVGLPDESSNSLLGRNRCCEQARGNILVFMDDHLSFCSSIDLEKVLHEHLERASCLGANIVSDSQSLLYGGGVLWKNAAPSYFKAQKLNSDPLIETKREVFFCSGGLFALLRESFISHGMFAEEAESQSMQDILFCLRAKLSKEYSYTIPELIVLTDKTSLDTGISKRDLDLLRLKHVTEIRSFPDPFKYSPREAISNLNGKKNKLCLQFSAERATRLEEGPKSTTPTDVSYLTLKPGDCVADKVSFISENTSAFEAIFTHDLAWLRLLGNVSETVKSKLKFIGDGLFLSFSELLTHLDSISSVSKNGTFASNATNFSSDIFYFDGDQNIIITLNQFIEFTSSASSLEFTNESSQQFAARLGLQVVSEDSKEEKTFLPAQPIKIRNESPITIVVPVYGQLELLRKCLGSIDSYCKKDFHLVVVNDKSPDLSESELKDLIASYEFPSTTVINKSINSGFADSVNIGLLHSVGDVLLLNSDAELTEDTLKNLYATTSSDNLVASITATSDDDSVSGLCLDDFLLSNSPLASSLISKALGACKVEGPVELPTGVGYCMLVKEQALRICGMFDSATFGRGYGEENDWSVRASRNGYKHLLSQDAYVYHAARKSFGYDEKLRDYKLQLVNALHPGYNERVDKLYSSGLLQERIAKVKFAISSAKPESEATLFIDLKDSVGGANEFLQQKIKQSLKSKQRCYALLLSDDGFYLADYNWSQPAIKMILRSQLLRDVLPETIAALGVKQVFLNNFVSNKRDEIISFLLSTQLPYEVFLHDYFAACPSVHLRNHESQYCNAEKSISVCGSCSSSILKRRERLNLQSVFHGIEQWRTDSEALLLGATKVTTPSLAAAGIVNSYFPSVSFQVEPHSEPTYCENTYDDLFALETPLVVGLLGSISLDKGAELVYQLAEHLEQHQMPMILKIIGNTAFHQKACTLNSGYLEILGAYDKLKVSQLLAEHHCGLVLLPFLIPESYSYTTDEALLSGFPVLTSSIGAQVERVEARSQGWCFEAGNFDNLITKLVQLESNRAEIQKNASSKSALKVA